MQLFLLVMEGIKHSIILLNYVLWKLASSQAHSEHASLGAPCIHLPRTYDSGREDLSRVSQGSGVASRQGGEAILGGGAPESPSIPHPCCGQTDYERGRLGLVSLAHCVPSCHERVPGCISIFFLSFLNKKILLGYTYWSRIRVSVPFGMATRSFLTYRSFR